jgi:hypothetical protein
VVRHREFKKNDGDRPSAHASMRRADIDVFRKNNPPDDTPGTGKSGMRRFDPGDGIPSE